MSNVKIILHQLKLINIHEVRGEVFEEKESLYWNDKIFIFSDEVLAKLKKSEKINKKSEFSKGNFKLTIIETDDKNNFHEWRLEEININTTILAGGYYKEKISEDKEKIELLLSLADGQELLRNKHDLYRLEFFKFALKKFHKFLFEAEIGLEEYYKRFGKRNEYLEGFIINSIRNESILLLAKVYDKSKSAISLLSLNEILCSNYQNWKDQGEGEITPIYPIDEINNYCQNVKEKFLEWEQPSQNIVLLRNERDKCICHIDIEEMFRYHILNSPEKNNDFNPPLGKMPNKKQLEELIDYGKEVCKQYADFLGLDLFPFYETYKLKILERDKRG